MIGPPGSGKSMLAARLPTILPTLSPAELLEVSMIASVAGEIEDGALTDRRPFRAPHHSASMPALVGGGLRAKPGEVSLAHHGVLFLASTRCASRLKPARSRSRAPTTASPIRRASCWSRR
jgi:magnesium chelatase family protein